MEEGGLVYADASAPGAGVRRQSEVDVLRIKSGFCVPVFEGAPCKVQQLPHLARQWLAALLSRLLQAEFQSHHAAKVLQ
mgnify:CR=1 FL=1